MPIRATENSSQILFELSHNDGEWVEEKCLVLGGGSCAMCHLCPRHCLRTDSRKTAVCIPRMARQDHKCNPDTIAPW